MSFLEKLCKITLDRNRERKVSVDKPGGGGSKGKYLRQRKGWK